MLEVVFSPLKTLKPKYFLEDICQLLILSASSQKFICEEWEYEIVPNCVIIKLLHLPKNSNKFWQFP